MKTVSRYNQTQVVLKFRTPQSAETVIVCLDQNRPQDIENLTDATITEKTVTHLSSREDRNDYRDEALEIGLTRYPRR